MTAMIHSTPYSQELVTKWCTNMREAVTTVTRNKTLTMGTAKEITALNSPLRHWGDNLANYLTHTGKQSVSAEKYFDAAFRYATANVSKVCGDNGKVSFDEARKLADRGAADMIADVFVMRGRLPPGTAPVPAEPATASLAAFDAMDKIGKAAVMVDVVFGTGALPAGIAIDDVAVAVVQATEVPSKINRTLGNIEMTEYSPYDPLDGVWDGGSSYVPQHMRFTYITDEIHQVTIDGQKVGYLALLEPSHEGEYAWVAFDNAGKKLDQDVSGYELR